MGAASVSVLNGRIHLKTEYKFKDRCKAIPCARWNPEGRAWTYPASPAVAIEIVNQFGQVDTDKNFDELVEQSLLINKVQNIKQSEDLPDIPNTKFKPWLHQKKAFWFSKDLRAAMLALDMGTGKTKITIDIINNREDIKKVLVLCPKSVISVWGKEINKHSVINVNTLCLCENNQIKIKTEQAKTFLNSSIDGKQVVVINYEAAWREPFSSFALSQKWDLVILDESHKIKAPGGAASRFCAKLGTVAKNRICLTGTPMPHSPLDIYAQYRFLDPGIFGTNFGKFKERYAIMGGYQNYEIKGYKNQTELNEKMFKIAFRVTKDILELPEYVDIEREVTLGERAQALYKEMESNFYAEIEDGTIATAANALTKLLRLQQITSGFLKNDDLTISQIDNNKQNVLAEVIDDIPTNEAIVVFCRFQNDLNIVKKIVEESKRKFAELSGRKNELQKWQNGEADVIGVQIQTGGVGIDLTRACYAIYYSLGFSLGDYEQSRARVHRPGQERSVKYIHLVAKNTVDEKVYEALSERKDVIENILKIKGCNI